MQKKVRERIFYLDFIRTIAVILIIITHYNAVFVFGLEPALTDRCVITEFPFGIYVGDLGVSLFLIISGAALMYVYEGDFDIKLFYKKRFWAIYPMFWIAYIVAVLPRLEVWRNLEYFIPKWRYAITFIGMDGYLSEYCDTFYVLGEWFLGFIIIFYLIFPFIRWLINKNEIVFWIVILVIYALCLIFYDMQMSMSKFIFIRLPELCFGMTFIKHRMKLKWYYIIPAIAILVINTIEKPQLSSNIQTTYIGISFFLVLVFISYYVNYSFVNKICSFVSKYSYAVFLVHHVVIEHIQAGFNLARFSPEKSYVLFMVSLVFIFITAVLLNASSMYVVDVVKKKLCRQ